jgi:hypothetical protein
MLAPNVRHASVYRLRSSAFMGLPWPKNAAGMRWSVIEVDSLLRGPFDPASQHADLAHQPSGGSEVLLDDLAVLPTGHRTEAQLERLVGDLFVPPFYPAG